MVERPTIHVNLGRARALINAATDTVYAAMAETDARIAALAVIAVVTGVAVTYCQTGRRIAIWNSEEAGRGN